MVEPVSKDDKPVNTAPATQQTSGLKFHPDVAFWSVLATAAVALITQFGTQNPQYATIAGVIALAISSGLQKYESMNQK